MNQLVACPVTCKGAAREAGAFAGASVRLCKGQAASPAADEHRREQIMSSMSLWHWIVIIGTFFILLFPMAKILIKAGYSGWWCIISLVPFLNFTMLWVLTYAPWPKLPEPAAAG